MDILRILNTQSAAASVCVHVSLNLCLLMPVLGEVFMALQRKGAHLFEAKRIKFEIENVQILLKLVSCYLLVLLLKRLPTCCKFTR